MKKNSMKMFKEKKMIKRHGTAASLLIASIAATLVAVVYIYSYRDEHYSIR